MKKDMISAKDILISEQLTCCLVKGDSIYKSTKRGVSPLLSWYDKGERFSGFCAADKVVGKAAAYLYVLLGVSQVYASVISTPAKEVLLREGITVFFDTQVPGIINREGNGPCPMEACVKDISDAQSALGTIRKKLLELSAK